MNDRCVGLFAVEAKRQEPVRYFLCRILNPSLHQLQFTIVALAFCAYGRHESAGANGINLATLLTEHKTEKHRCISRNDRRWRWCHKYCFVLRILFIVYKTKTRVIETNSNLCLHFTSSLFQVLTCKSVISADSEIVLFYIFIY